MPNLGFMSLKTKYQQQYAMCPKNKQRSYQTIKAPLTIITAIIRVWVETKGRSVDDDW